MSHYDPLYLTLQSYTDRVSVTKVRLNSGGYTSNGCYFGVGSPLYFIQDYDGHFSSYVRASCREDAVRKIRKIYPKAKIRG